MAIRRVALLHILRDTEVPPLLAGTSSFLEMVGMALDPAISITRYGRRWRLSRPTIQDDRWLEAKLGFERLRESARIYYDEDTEDFVVEDARIEAATFAHFVLDLQNQYLLFDYRPPDIRLQSFVGALQDVCDSSSVGRLLRVAPVSDTAEFFQWLSDLDRVDSVKITVRRPNPSFEGRPQRIRELIQETKSAVLNIEARASRLDDNGLSVEGTDLETLATYAADGNGDVRALGQRGTQTVRYSSRRNVREDEIETTSDDTSPSIFQKIKDRLEQMTR